MENDPQSRNILTRGAGWCGLWVGLGLLAVPSGGCTTTPTGPATNIPQSWSFPAEGQITERAVLTARGRQFAWDGYVTRSPAGGLRLLITSDFGQIFADVLVQANGRVVVMHPSRVLRPAWIHDYVARDLMAVFGQPPPADPEVRLVEPDHFVIHRRWYTLDLRIVQTTRGPQPLDHFDPTHRDPP